MTKKQLQRLKTPETNEQRREVLANVVSDIESRILATPSGEDRDQLTNWVIDLKNVMYSLNTSTGVF